jgi:GTP-binding protein
MSEKLPVVTIVGRANVGKSSLFNRLLGQRKAIVHEAPGTTRDRVEAIVEWQGRQFWLVDTAGLENEKDQLARSVQEQIKVAREQADIMVVTIDGSTILSEEDAKVIKQARGSGKPLITAINKTDRATQPIEREKLPEPSIPVSAIHGSGSGDLLDTIVDIAGQYPAGEAATIPTLALLGRPNVGKSSLLNVLAGHERAIVSQAPGTTRDMTEIRVNHEGQTWHITDTAGLRRKNKTGKHLERFSSLRALGAISSCEVCALVLDATEPATAQEQRIAGMVKEAGKGLVMVVNKWDQTERNNNARGQLEDALGASFQFVWWAPLLLVSATEQHHVNKLLPLASAAAGNRQKTVATKDLNETLQAAVANHPPAGLKDRHPKLNYITQTDTAPPTFTVYGRHTRFLHWSYKRYLETRLRERFDFDGTPIRLQWRQKQEAGRAHQKGKGEAS